MYLLTIFLCIIFMLKISEQSQSFSGETYPSSTLDCPSGKHCISIDYCSTISALMNRNLLPIHRFRQAICGYDNTKPKVCCNSDSNLEYPLLPQENNILFTNSNSISECGKSLVQSDFDTIGSYPFVARIGFKSISGDIKYPCSGVIVSERTILTTASCALATSNNYKLYSVLIGEFDSDTNIDCNALFCGHETRKYNISYIIKHPNYDPNTYSNNIAMLRLEESIQYSVTSQPVCLLPRDRYESAGANSILVGWGKIGSRQIKSGKQQSLKMRILPNKECTSYYTRGFAVDLCAIGDEIPCSGYSGSPLLIKHSDTYFLVGILSYGSNCNSGANFPSVFVGIQRYTRWILENC